MAAARVLTSIPFYPESPTLFLSCHAAHGRESHLKMDVFSNRLGSSVCIQTSRLSQLKVLSSYLVSPKHEHQDNYPNDFQGFGPTYTTSTLGPATRLAQCHPQVDIVNTGLRYIMGLS